MPNYTVKITIGYPVQAKNAEDALATVPMVVRMRYTNCLAEGVTEILDAATKEVVLRAQLNPDRPKEKK